MPESSSKLENDRMKENRKTLTRVNDKDTNPCLKEADISMRCLEKHLYVREKCKLEYDNYNQCKKFWGMIRSKRRLAGITPHLPKEEERNKILEMRAKGIHVNSVR